MLGVQKRTRHTAHRVTLESELPCEVEEDALDLLLGERDAVLDRLGGVGLSGILGHVVLLHFVGGYTPEGMRDSEEGVWRVLWCSISTSVSQAKMVLYE
jgi:hypothetical protein